MNDKQKHTDSVEVEPQEKTCTGKGCRPCVFTYMALILGAILVLDVLWGIQEDTTQIGMEIHKEHKELPMNKTESEWKQKLTDEQYRVLREKGTERAFTGDLLENKKTGVYSCGGCGADLFHSHTKYDSGSGWPSFFDVISSDAVTLIEDKSHGMVRTEVTCAKCGGHLGHVFPDGPAPTGTRFCINSASLAFEEGE